MNSTPLHTIRQTALVVDDDVFSRELLRKDLLQMGIAEVALAQNGREGVLALNKLADGPDFLICDIFMPDMDGIEFIAELTCRKYIGGLILVTGVNIDMLEVASDIATHKGLKVLGCFTKPLQKQQLKQALGLAALT